MKLTFLPVVYYSWLPFILSHIWYCHELDIHLHVVLYPFTYISSAMEHTLRCNVLKCRRELGDRALVTTCRYLMTTDIHRLLPFISKRCSLLISCFVFSHIFCTECASQYGLTNASGRHEHRNSCPACSSNLTNPDDAVISNLNPSDDYKTSVLSGLSPNVIIECASRALSFWAYQTTQEV